MGTHHTTTVRGRSLAPYQKSAIGAPRRLSGSHRLSSAVRAAPFSKPARVSVGVTACASAQALYSHLQADALTLLQVGAARLSMGAPPVVHAIRQVEPKRRISGAGRVQFSRAGWVFTHGYASDLHQRGMRSYTLGKAVGHDRVRIAYARAA